MYRDGSRENQVLSTGTASPKAAAKLADLDPDRRLRLDKTPPSFLAGLRWGKRPVFPNGNPAMCCMLRTPEGSFAVMVGYTANGTKRPFEVWVNGAEVPRGLGAIAKSLSMDFRQESLAYAKWKLAKLMTVSGEASFWTPMPPRGEDALVPSAVAAFAKAVFHACEEMGAFDGVDESSVVEHLMFPEALPTGPQGTIAKRFDLLDPVSNERFHMVVSEVELPNGQNRPYELTFGGHYPKTLDGLAVSLSEDMRVWDPGWAGAKLRQIADFPEYGGAILLRLPWEKKGRTFPSVVAYIATLVLHRYAELGILDEEGFAVRGESALASAVLEAEAPVAQVRTMRGGRRCPKCGNLSVVPYDGCEVCRNPGCDWIGSCG